MRIRRMLALGASVLVLMSACTTGGSGSTSPSSSAGSPPATNSGGQTASASASVPATATEAPPQIKIGSAGFYEVKIVAEIYAEALEAKGYKVDRVGIGLGTRDVTNPALESGQIDLEPEYIGSDLASYEPGKQTGDPQENMTNLQAVLATKGGGITVLPFSPAADQNAFVVRPETATQYHLTTLSDTTAVQNQLKWGLATDCKTNPVCAAALKTAYGLQPKNVTYLSACDTPMAQALLNKTIDVGELCSTQPDISKNGWTVLQDDKQTQPADNIAPLVRDDLLAKMPDKDAFEAVLNAVSAKLTTATLTQLNASFTFDNKDVNDIAAGWLKDNGLGQ